MRKLNLDQHKTADVQPILIDLEAKVPQGTALVRYTNLGVSGFGPLLFTKDVRGRSRTRTVCIETVTLDKSGDVVMHRYPVRPIDHKTQKPRCYKRSQVRSVQIGPHMIINPIRCKSIHWGSSESYLAGVLSRAKELGLFENEPAEVFPGFDLYSAPLVKVNGKAHRVGFHDRSDFAEALTNGVNFDIGEQTGRLLKITNMPLASAHPQGMYISASTKWVLVKESALSGVTDKGQTLHLPEVQVGGTTEQKPVSNIANKRNKSKQISACRADYCRIIDSVKEDLNLTGKQAKSLRRRNPIKAAKMAYKDNVEYFIVRGMVEDQARTITSAILDQCVRWVNEYPELMASALQLSLKEETAVSEVSGAPDLQPSSEGRSSGREAVI